MSIEKLSPGDKVGISFASGKPGLPNYESAIREICADIWIVPVFDVSDRKKSPEQFHVDEAWKLSSFFADNDIRAVFMGDGGSSSILSLEYLDYDVISLNPKPFVAFSDATTIANALLKASGLPSISFPSLSGLYRKPDAESVSLLKKALFSESERFELGFWTDVKDPTASSACSTVRKKLTSGDFKMHWTSIGGNLSSFSLLFGTRYLPSPEKAVLFLEESSQTPAAVIEREFWRIRQSNLFSRISGIVFWRFQEWCGILADGRNPYQIAEDVFGKDFPMAFSADFWHIRPSSPFPIWVWTTVVSKNGRPSISFKS